MKRFFFNKNIFLYHLNIFFLRFFLMKAVFLLNTCFGTNIFLLNIWFLVKKCFLEEKKCIFETFSFWKHFLSHFLVKAWVLVKILKNNKKSVMIKCWFLKKELKKLRTCYLVKTCFFLLRHVLVKTFFWWQHFFDEILFWENMFLWVRGNNLCEKNVFYEHMFF